MSKPYPVNVVPPMPTASAALCVMLGTLTSEQVQPWMNFIYFSPDREPPPGWSTSTFVSYLWNAWQTAAQPCSSNYTALANVAYFWQNSSGLYTGQQVGAEYGDILEPYFPNAVNALIQKFSGSHRPPVSRFWMGGVCPSLVGADGAFTSIGATLYGNVINFITSPLSNQGVNFYPAIFSLKYDAMFACTSATLFHKPRTFMRRSSWKDRIWPGINIIPNVPNT